MALEVIEGYEIDRTKPLGKGGFGAVFEARQIDPASDKKLAVKISDEEHSEDLQSEANLLKKSFHHVALIQKDQNYYLFMERVAGKNLHDLKLLAGFPFKERIKFLWLLALDLNELHHHKIRGDAQVHLDIKPGNIMVDVDEENKKVNDARLVDRGNAHEMESSHRKVSVAEYNTPGYVSPEMAGKKRFAVLRSDIPPFAVVMFEVLGVAKPFKGVTIIARPIMAKEFAQDVPEVLKLSLSEFGQRMASTQYALRPDSDEVLEFFTALNNFSQTEEKERKAEYLETLECIAMPHVRIKEKLIPILAPNIWKQFVYACDHFEGNEKKWAELAKAVVRNIDNYMGEQIAEFHRELDKHPQKSLELQFALAEDIEQYPDASRTYFFNRLAAQKISPNITFLFSTQSLQIKLELFLCLSKKKYVENNPHYSGRLGEIILKEIRERDGANHVGAKQKLTLLRYLNKHNKQGEYNEARQAIINVFKEELHKYKITKVLPQKKWFFNAERRAVRKLDYAMSTSCFFKGYRQRLLKEALNGKDKNTSAIVQQFSARAA